MKLPGILTIILSLGLISVVQMPGFAKAAFLSKKAMIDQAVAIAIVDVSKIDATTTKGHAWTYHQKATATVEQTLKGTLPKTITLYADEDFICAHCQFKGTGRYLVFLRKDVDLLVGSNWQFSFRPTHDKKLEWYDDDGKSLFSTKLMDENVVVEEVKQELAGQRNLTTLPEYLKTLLAAPRLQDGTIGEGQEVNSCFPAYEKAKKQGKNIEPELQLLLKNATPSGRMYAAFLLNSIDQEAGRKAFLSLKKDLSTFTYQSGCKATEWAVYQAADQVLTTKKFLNFPI